MKSKLKLQQIPNKFLLKSSVFYQRYEQKKTYKEIKKEVHNIYGVSLKKREVKDLLKENFEQGNPILNLNTPY